MALNTVLLSVLLAVASLLCAVGVWGVVEMARASRSLRTLADDLDANVMPVIEKADVTVDALNAELLRADAVMSRIEEITDRVESTSRTVQNVANAPTEIVTDIADRVRRAWKRRQAENAAEAKYREAAAAVERKQAEAEAEAASEPLGDRPPEMGTNDSDAQEASPV